MVVLDRVPVERITAEARQIELGRTVLTLLAGLFYVVGWLAAKLVNVVWFAFAGSWAAVKVGWKEGRASSALVSKGG
jgi:hypothetical protein